MKKPALLCIYCSLTLLGLSQTEDRFKGLNKKELQDTILRTEHIYLQKLEEKDSILKEHEQTIQEIKESNQEIQYRLDQTESTVETRNELIDTLRKQIDSLHEQIDFLHAHIDFLHEHLTEVRIGNQVWMTQNLNVDKFRNGDPIPQAKTDEEWKKAGENGQPAWCYYDNSAKNGINYGKLYNGYAVFDPRGLAPDGYHIPSDDEWTELTDFLGGQELAGKKMKSKSGWGYDGNGTNESGFSALPGGYHSDYFHRIGKDGMWWSSSLWDRDNAYYRYLRNDIDFVGVGGLWTTLDRGMSVRCLRE